MSKSRLFLLVCLLCTIPLMAQNMLRVADDSSSGTYRKMLGELVNVCSTDALSVESVQGLSGGAPGNLDALYNNRADAAFLHSDVFFANAQADPSYAKFKTLLALWPEPIHILALRTSKTKKAATFSFGTVDINTLESTSGYAVGAAGGGVFTARILQGQGQGGFTVIAFNNGNEVIAALDSGTIAAAVFVGAAPLPNLEKLDKSKYKLVPIGESIASRVQGVYRETKINYNGLTNGPIKTMAPLAVLLTKPFATPAKQSAQSAMRSCFNAKLPELQDTASPNWQLVDPNDHGTLNNWLDLPSAHAPATTPRRR